ncbi:MAG: DUF4437 domain-containing protein [Bacteroidota bacterium]
MRLFVIQILILGFLSASLSAQEAPTIRILSSEEVAWTPLNPARGDASPQAANIWGDRKKDSATGFLVKFVKGFSSPPHIHNVTYRGVVIEGLLHNDDPTAQKMWMPGGSYWTQPAGEIHITAADDASNMAYIEIDSGPYLVLPTEKALDNGERPVNIDRSNIVWTKFSDATPNVERAYLWGSPQEEKLHGTMLKLPNGFRGNILSDSNEFHAVVIQGSLHYYLAGESPAAKATSNTLAPGSYFGSEGKATHHVSTSPNDACTIYIRTKGKVEIESDW